MESNATVSCPGCGSVYVLRATTEKAAVVICCSRAIIASQRTAWAFPDSPSMELKVIGHSDFELENYISEGATAVVLSAFHKVLERWVALKVTKLSGQSDLRLELQAARKTAQIRIHGVPTIYEVTRFLDELTGRTHRVVVMDLVEGSSLSAMSEDDLQKVDRNLAFRNLCRVLSDAHAHEFLHGDLESLENILIGEKSDAYIIDPGLSKSLDGGNRFEGFMQSDLRALVRAGAKLLGVELVAEVEPGDDVVSTQRRIEKLLGQECAVENRLYSLQRRQEYIFREGWHLPPYRITDVHTIVEIDHGGNANFASERSFEPFVPLASLELAGFSDSRMSRTELNPRVFLRTCDDLTPLPFDIEEPLSTADESIFRIRIKFDPPLAPDCRHSVVWKLTYPSSMNPNEDSYSYDLRTYVGNLVIVFKFVGLEVPEKWIAKRQSLPESEYFEDIPSSEFLVIDRITRTATWRFSDLRPPGALHFRYSRS